MKIFSLIRNNDELVPVEVEISLVPGLPQIQYLGLPDQAIKESTHRIKSAIRAQGFDFPKAQQVLVNLRPAHLKKNSRGLELAVAFGILHESQQIHLPEEKEIYVYGELSLRGEVFEPEDLAEDFDSSDVLTLWTGSGGQQGTYFNRYIIDELKEIPTPTFHKGRPRHYEILRPNFGLDLHFSEAQASLIRLISVGEHSCLLAGPAGSGKSTLAKTIHSFLKAPSTEEMHKVLKNNPTQESPFKWRPLIQPHHTTTALGLIGGGTPLFKGEVSRAHLGVLVLDELLEFHQKAQEALREPMEEDCIHLRRGRYVQKFLAQALYIATTNLCPCGDWTPKGKVVCGRSIRRCHSYLEKLSGPLVDRFHILFFTDKRDTSSKTSGQTLLAEIQSVHDWRETLSKSDVRFLTPAARWGYQDLLTDIPSFYMQELFPKEISSKRRELATLRVARSLADLELSLTISPAHIEKAMKFTFQPFDALKRLG